MSDNIQHGFKPPRMSDGRAFTDFRPNCNMNKILQIIRKLLQIYIVIIGYLFEFLTLTFL